MIKTFQQLCDNLMKTYVLKNILIVNTDVTGTFLDKMFLDTITGVTITRIKYSKNEIYPINGIFDLILVDPYHEYYSSINTFKLLIPLLSDTGILVSHDCYPPSFECTSPVYKDGEWCGLTYIAFIETVYNNPDLFYGVLNTDYGLGIISKTKTSFTNKFEAQQKQNVFINMFRNSKSMNKVYKYFIAYSKDLINSQ